MLFRSLVDGLVERMDAFAWATALRLGRRLPGRFLPPGLRERAEAGDAFTAPWLDLDPIRQLLAILRDLPGFEPSLLLSRLPRLLAEPELRRMGSDLARGLAERGVVRLLRDVLVPAEPLLAMGGGNGGFALDSKQ